MWLLNWRMAVHVAAGELTAAESSSIKVFGTERTLDVFRLLAGIMGAARLSHPGLARRAAAGAHRGVRAPGADQHLRRRRQRGPARDCGDCRSRHDAGRPMSPVDGQRGKRNVWRSSPGTRTTVRRWRRWPERCRARPVLSRRGEPGDDPALGRGHGRREPGVRLGHGGPRRRFRAAVRAADHAPGLDHAGSPGIARGRGGPGGGDVSGQRWAQRGDDGPTGGGGTHFGGGDELRADL